MNLLYLTDHCLHRILINVNEMYVALKKSVSSKVESINLGPDNPCVLGCYGCLSFVDEHLMECDQPNQCGLKVKEWKVKERKVKEWKVC